jgi:hypothetical protein
MGKQTLIRVAVVLVGALLLMPVTPALADGGPPGDGVVIWNKDYTLGENEVLNGDLVVLTGDVSLERNSYVEGSVVIWNGNAEVAGTIEGDLVVSGGDIHLLNEAVVKGQVVCSWKCELEREPDARVDGGVIEGTPWRGFQFERKGGPSISLAPFEFWVTGPGEVVRWTLRILRNLAATVVVAVVAGLVALVWPDQIARVGRTVTEAPLPCLGFGVLTVIATVVAVILLAITICLSPLAALVALALGMTGLFGWIGIGALLGERLLKALNVRGVVPVVTAVVGTLLVTLIGAGPSLSFCLAPLGWFINFIVGCIGLGAVVLTRFGTAEYTSRLSVASASPSSPPREAELPPPVTEDDAV